MKAIEEFLVFGVKAVIAVAAFLVAAQLTTAVFNAWVPLPAVDQPESEMKRQAAFVTYYVVQFGAGFAAARAAWRWL